MAHRLDGNGNGNDDADADADADMDPDNVLVVGIGGPSSSGKTTLARLLTSILPGASVLHLDDFYKPSRDCPVDEATGLQNWDTADAIDIERFAAVLAAARRTGSLPDGYASLQPPDDGAGLAVDAGELAALCKSVRTALRSQRRQQRLPRLIIAEGFLLFTRPEIERLLDVKLLLRSRFATLQHRRSTRRPYIDPAGLTCEDPPGYFETVVWPYFLAEHEYLFVGRDIERGLDEKAARSIAASALDCSVLDALRWAADVVVEHLRVASARPTGRDKARC